MTTPVPVTKAESGANPFSFGLVFPIFALTFVDVLGLTIILPLLHLYALRFNASPLQIGLVAAAFPLAQVIGVPVMGALSDQFGRKPMLLISQVTTCLAFLMLAAAGSLEIIILSRVIDGLFGANFSTAQAAMADVTTDENRARGLGITGAAFGVGFLFGPAIALAALEVSDNLALPALIAAVYSFLSILLTLFMFRETLPPERRSKTLRPSILLSAARVTRRPHVPLLLGLLFSEQMAFFAFESLLGLFMLNRLGLLGQGSALIFIYVGLVLVMVQARFIGKWARKYGEKRLVLVALGLLAFGLLAFAFTPEQAHPLYLRSRAERDMRAMTSTGTEAIIGDLAATLPTDADRGFGGLLWLMAALIPIAIGSGLMRPMLNTLMTRQVEPSDYGAMLGVSAAFATAANAAAPIVGGLLYQARGPSAPFLVGGLGIAVLLVVAGVGLRTLPERRA